MRCPFLREARVKSCQASAFRKMIVDNGRMASERCTSPEWPACPAARARAEGAGEGTRCPFLQESHVEYCAAASVPKYVPASDALLSHCTTDAHFYCESFLAHADPSGTRLPRHAGEAAPFGARVPSVDGITVPANLCYAPNHMWLDVAEDGSCHVGIDAFLAKLLGRIEKVSFVSPRAVDRPVAVLTVNGVDLRMAFPNPMRNPASNCYLRTSAAKLTSDPYGAGWLFEGSDPMWRTGIADDTVKAGLIPGDRALAWIRDESDRLTAFAHECIARPDAAGERTMADGGRVEDGIALRLGREDLINLFNEFFPTQSEWRRAW